MTKVDGTRFFQSNPAIPKASSLGTKTRSVGHLGYMLFAALQASAAFSVFWFGLHFSVSWDRQNLQSCLRVKHLAFCINWKEYRVFSNSYDKTFYFAENPAKKWPLHGPRILDSASSFLVALACWLYFAKQSSPLSLWSSVNWMFWNGGQFAWCTQMWNP